VTPAGQKKPAAHGVHVTFEVALAAADHEPAAQGVGAAAGVAQK